MSEYEHARMNRVRRSELSTPGHSEKMIAKAAASDADRRAAASVSRG